MSLMLTQERKTHFATTTTTKKSPLGSEEGEKNIIQVSNNLRVE